MAQAKVDANDASAGSRGGPQGLLLRLLILAGASLALGLVFWLYSGDLALWAREAQREAQTALARGVRGVRAGDTLALATLLGVSFFYGFAHAIGPGHGKLLIAGAAVASRRTAKRMAGIGFLASLTQALSAIVLAYGALGAFSLTGRAAVGLAEGWLAPLSALAIALVGVWIMVRGVRGMWAERSVDAHHACGCGHAGCRHSPSAAETEKAETWLDTLSLVASIGVRPCSGALIVLAIAWNYGLYAAGALSALAMAVGTGAVVGGVALFATAFRDSQALRGGDATSRTLFFGVQILAGLGVALLSGLIAWASFGF